MGNLSKREKTIVIIGTILAVMYLYFNIFLNPIYQKIKVEKNIIYDKKVQIAAIEKLKTSNITDRKKLEDLKTKFTQGVSELPKNERNPEIARNLDVMAKESNVIISSVVFDIGTMNASKDSTIPATTQNKTNTITAENTNGNKKIFNVPVNLVVYGDYASVVSFTRNIEENVRLAQIVSTNISLLKDNNIVLQANIVINYYCYIAEGTIQDNPVYEFKDGKSGKDNLFN